LDTNPTTITSPPAARSLHDICQAARRGTCGPFCGALPGEECVFTSAPVSVPVTGDTPVRPARGYHLARFARAQSRGLISAAEFAAVTETAGSLTPAGVIFDTGQQGTTGRDCTVLGPFETSSQALLALQPDDGSFVGPEPRAELLRDTLSAAGVELGQWDRAILGWLAGLDVQTIAPVIGWVSRAGRGPAPGLIVQALADAIAYQTALASGCPDCSTAAPEGCAGHREDAARAAEYQRALRCLVTRREAQLGHRARSAAARCRPAPAVPRISSRSPPRRISARRRVLPMPAPPAWI
jgi:hypothetical protein